MAWVTTGTYTLPGFTAQNPAGQQGGSPPTMDGTRVNIPAAAAGVSQRRLQMTRGGFTLSVNGTPGGFSNGLFHYNVMLAIGPPHNWTGARGRVSNNWGTASYGGHNVADLGVTTGAFQVWQRGEADAELYGSVFGARAVVNNGTIIAVQDWMPAPAQTGVSVDSVTHNSARVVSASPPNTGRPTTTRIWQLATGAASTAVSHQVSTGNQTTGSFTGLAGNTTYRARVINRNATGDSAASPWVNFTTRPAPPAATAVVVDQIKWNGARLASARPAATGAALQRRWQVEQVGGGLVWSQTTGDVLEAAATGLQGSTAYRARVQNFNTTGDAAWSAWVEFTTAPAERAWIGGKEMARAFIGGISVGQLWQAGQRVWNRP